MLGAVLVGDNSYYDTLLQYAQNGIKLPADASGLILPQTEGAPTLGPDALPASATICSCHNVSKGAVCCQVDAGVTDLGELKAATKAATGCGGCNALLKLVFDAELAARGVAVDKSLCEHFAYTRQELYGIVRVEGIQASPNCWPSTAAAMSVATSASRRWVRSWPRAGTSRSPIRR